MNVVEALSARYSVRAFKPDPVSKETMLAIIAAANRSPSWANTQPWEVYVAGGEPLNRLRAAFLARHDQGTPRQPEMTTPQSWPPEMMLRIEEAGAIRNQAMGFARDDREGRRAISRLNFEFFKAPVVVYLCLDRTLTPWSIFDTGMFAQSMMLAAVQLGVGSIPAINLVAFPDLLRSELPIPDNLMIMLGIAMGYADETHIANRPRSPRRPVEEVVKFVGM